MEENLGGLAISQHQPPDMQVLDSLASPPGDQPLEGATWGQQRGHQGQHTK